jgi:DNA invertase Pin-like site-specific DNA recombinase
MVIQRCWELKEEYVDHGVSSRDVRPQLERLMKDARKHKFDVVGVWKFDRFARSTRELVFALEQFQNLGIDFVSVTQSIDTSGPMGRLVFSVLAAIAEFERDLIRERVIAGIREARKKGKHCGRPAIAFDVDSAADLRKGGLSWRKLSSATGVAVHLLRARLSGKAQSAGD